jgi:hypothetical protein
MIFLVIAGILALSPLSFPEIKAAAEKSTGYFIILKVDHVDSLSEASDQKVIMERAIELLQEKLVSLKLRSVELKRKSKDIIILSYQGGNEPWQVAQSLQPKDLVVSFTVIGIFKGQEISEVAPR